MFTTTQLYKNNIFNANRQIKAKIKINQTTYFEEKIISMKLEEQVNPGENFMLGSVASASLSLVLEEIPTNGLANASIEPFVGVEISGSVEYIPLGVFILEEAKTINGETKISAFDNMVKLEYPYFSNLSYPATIQSIADEIALQTGVVFKTVLPNLQINEQPIGYTSREVMGLIASSVGGFARFDRVGELEILFYSNANLTITTDLYYDLELAEKNFVVQKLTVVKRAEDGEQIFTSGVGNEVIYQNNFINQSLFDYAFNRVNNFSYMPYRLNWMGDPSLQAGDKITIVDENGISRNVPIMQLSLTYDGGLESVCIAIGKSESANKFQSTGSQTQVMQRYIVEQALIKEILANKASFQDLQAYNARIQNLETNSATITQLSASNAKITTLETETAAINFILAGRIGASNIAAGAIQAGSAIIAENAIGNAQIGSVSANKLTAGVIDASVISVINLVADNIITGSITVDGGNLIRNTEWLTDATHWSLDGAFTRNTATKYDTSNSMTISRTGLGADSIKYLLSEQIDTTEGQKFVVSCFVRTPNRAAIDSSGFRIGITFYNSSGAFVSRTVVNAIPAADNTWQKFVVSGTVPANGAKVMFTGMLHRNGTVFVARPILQRGSLASEWRPHTDELISNGAIGNAKIASNAAIEGSKLNISSVVSAINSGGTNISSSKVSVDGGTLEAKFADMKNTVTSQGETLSSQSATLTAHASAINLKVDTQTYTTKMGELDGSIISINTNLNKATSDIAILNGQIVAKVSQTEIDNSIRSIPRSLAGQNLMPLTAVFWEQGSLSAAGANLASTFRIRTIGTIRVKSDTGYVVLGAKSGLEVGVFQYKADGTFLVSNVWITTDKFVITTHAEATYVKFIIRFNDTTTILPSAVNAMALSFEENLQGQIDGKASQEGLNGVNTTLSSRITTTEASLAVLSDSVSLKASKAELDTLSNRTTLNEASITAVNNKIALEVSTINANMASTNTNVSEIKTYMHFDSNGMTLGKTNSPLQINISNNQMNFLDNGATVAYVNGQKMYINSLDVISSLVVGVHKIEKYNSDITFVRWVG